MLKKYTSQLLASGCQVGVCEGMPISLSQFGLQMPSVPGEELSISAPMVEWLRKLHANASALRGRQISSLQWQESMDQIYAGTPLEALRSRLGFDALRRQIIERIPAERGELFHRAKLSSCIELSRSAPIVKKFAQTCLLISSFLARTA